MPGHGNHHFSLFSFICLLIWIGALLLLAGCAAPAQAPAGEVVKTVEVAKTQAAQTEGETILSTATRDGAAPAAPAATEAPAEAPAATEAPAVVVPVVSEAVSTQLALPTASPVGAALNPTQAAAATPQPTAKAQDTDRPAPTQAPPAAPTQPAEPQITGPTSNYATLVPPAASPDASMTPEQTSEARIVQLEWPGQIRLGESDVIRLSLVHSSLGYTLITEFPEHTTITQTVQIEHPPGYQAYAVARLDGPAFEIQPGEEQSLALENTRLDWRWSLTPRQAGRQRLNVVLSLRWVPLDPAVSQVHEVGLHSRSIEINVLSFFGLTRTQALITGLFSLLFSGGLGAFALIVRPRTGRLLPRLALPQANTGLQIELPAGMALSPEERLVIQTLFHRYGRLVIEQEFLSGYSGARSFLALPVRLDGRQDAYTIAKLGENDTIRAEFANYETYVKDTLPPITARIQHTPVGVRPARGVAPNLAAVQYTFIGEAGHPPVSLRQALLANPDPELLYKLLDTFGPNWWLQRRPYTFRLSVEYDRMLPSHLVLEPLPATEGSTSRPALVELDGRASPVGLKLQPGSLVRTRRLAIAERRLDRHSLSLAGQPPPGHPPLRVRWLSTTYADGTIARVVDTRWTLLRSYAGDAPQLARQLDLPEPFPLLPALLAETVSGSQSTIHGDMNLENVLLGPGGLVWLIDFAQTRDGHTLIDFAHLYAEIIAHILAPQIASPQAFASGLRESYSSAQEISDGCLFELLQTVDSMAQRCLFNPSRPREFDLAVTLATLGALKYANLDTHARTLLYLAGAYRSERLI